MHLERCPDVRGHVDICDDGESSTFVNTQNINLLADVAICSLMLAISPFFADSKTIHIGSVPFFDGHIHLLAATGLCA